MSYTFDEYLRKIGCKTQDRVNALTAPLRDFFACPYFSYQRIDSLGGYQNLGDRPDWVENFIEQKFYLQSTVMRHPKFFSSGVCLLSSFGTGRPSEAALREHGIGSTVLVLNRNIDSLEVFGFSSSVDDGEGINRLLSELASLKTFCSYFKNEASKLLEGCDSVDLCSLRGQDFLTGPVITPSLKGFDRLQFLVKFDAERPYLRADSLTERERQCLAFLREGFTMSGIAEELKLSARTIEHYLESCKDKLLCYTRRDLIQFANALERVGFFASSYEERILKPKELQAI